MIGRSVGAGASCQKTNESHSVVQKLEIGDGSIEYAQKPKQKRRMDLLLPLLPLLLLLLRRHFKSSSSS